MPSCAVPSKQWRSIPRPLRRWPFQRHNSPTSPCGMGRKKSSSQRTYAGRPLLLVNIQTMLLVNIQTTHYTHIKCQIKCVYVCIYILYLYICGGEKWLRVGHKVWHQCWWPEPSVNQLVPAQPILLPQPCNVVMFLNKKQLSWMTRDTIGIDRIA